MPIVLNKNGLQSKRVEDVDNSKDVIITYDSPAAKPLTPAQRGAKGYVSSGNPLENLGRLPTANEIKNTLTVSAVEEPKNKLDSISKGLRDKIQRLRTQNLRSRGQLNFNREANLAVLAASKDIIDNVRGVRDAPQLIKTVYREPSQLKNIPSEILRSGENFGKLIRESPTEAISIVGTEILLLKTGGVVTKATRKSLKVAFKQANRISKKTGQAVRIRIKTPEGSKLLLFPNMSIKNIRRVERAFNKIKRIPTKTLKITKKNLTKLKIQHPGTYSVAKQAKNDLKKFIGKVKEISNSRKARKYERIFNLRKSTIKKITKRRLDAAKYNFRVLRGRKLNRIELKSVEKNIRQKVENELLNYKIPTLRGKAKNVYNRVSSKVADKITYNSRRIKYFSKKAIKKIAVQPKLVKQARNEIGKLSRKINKISNSRQANRYKKMNQLRQATINKITKRRLDFAKFQFRKTYGRKLSKGELRKVKAAIKRRVTDRVVNYKTPTIRQRITRTLNKKVRINKKLRYPSINEIQKQKLKIRIKRGFKIAKVKTFKVANKKIRISGDFLKKPIKQYLRNKRNIKITKLKKIVEARATKQALDRAKFVFRKNFGRKLNRREIKVLKGNIRKNIFNELMKAKRRLEETQQARYNIRMSKSLKGEVKTYSRGKIRPIARIRKFNYKVNLGKPQRQLKTLDFRNIEIVNNIPKNRTIFKAMSKKNGKVIKIAKFEEPEIPRGHIAVKGRNGQILVLKKPKNILKSSLKSKKGFVKFANKNKFFNGLITSGLLGFAQSSRLFNQAKTKYLTLTIQGQRQGSAVISGVSDRQGQPGAVIPKPIIKQYQNQDQPQKQLIRYRYPTKQKTKQKLRRIPKKILFIPSRKEGKRIKKFRYPVQAFNVYGKSGRRFIKLNKNPLSKNDALSRGAYAIDHSTSKTFKIIPAGKRKVIGLITSKENRYFGKKSFKLRGIKINRGKKYKLLNKYIEKRRFGIDTYGEKRGLTLARLKKSKKW